MRILILGSDYLAEAFRGLGIEAITCGLQPCADLCLDCLDPDYSLIRGLLKNKGLSVDAILVTDNVGVRQLPTGLWSAGPITAFYGVDSTLNRFWQTPYAQLFDLVFLDQRREVEGLANLHSQTHWLPMAVEPELYKGESKEPEKSGICFVGVVDPKIRPKRSAILSRVARITDVTVKGGRREKWFSTQEAAELYRNYALVLNENLFPGVTTRPLEAMAAGGATLSEAAPGNMDLLFQDGKHLAFFVPEDLEQKLELYLGDINLRRRLRKAGREEIFTHHGLKNRAEKIVNKIKQIMESPPPERPRAQGGDALRLEGEALLMAGLRWPKRGGAHRLLRAAGRLDTAFKDGAEPLNAARWAGLAHVAVNRPSQALACFTRSAELGGQADRLTWGLTAWLTGRRALAEQTFTGMGAHWGAGPGEARFHLEAANLLIKDGRDMTPGFTRRRLAPPFWDAIDHLNETIALAPGMAVAWEMMGDILMAWGAAAEAHPLYKRAGSLKKNSQLAEKEALAAREGYIL